jgi:hypothetical protein
MSLLSSVNCDYPQARILVGDDRLFPLLSWGRENFIYYIHKWYRYASNLLYKN